LIYLYGPNGSGKSTLFKMMCGIEVPDAGQIRVAEGETIGAVIENTGFIENASLDENLRYLFNIKGRYDPSRVGKLCS